MFKDETAGPLKDGISVDDDDDDVDVWVLFNFICPVG